MLENGYSYSAVSKKQAYVWFKAWILQNNYASRLSDLSLCDFCPFSKNAGLSNLFPVNPGNKIKFGEEAGRKRCYMLVASNWEYFESHKNKL